MLSPMGMSFGERVTYTGPDAGKAGRKGVVGPVDGTTAKIMWDGAEELDAVPVAHLRVDPASKRRNQTARQWGVIHAIHTEQSAADMAAVFRIGRLRGQSFQYQKFAKGTIELADSESAAIRWALRFVVEHAQGGADQSQEVEALRARVVGLQAENQGFRYKIDELMRRLGTDDAPATVVAPNNAETEREITHLRVQIAELRQENANLRNRSAVSVEVSPAVPGPVPSAPKATSASPDDAKRLRQVMAYRKLAARDLAKKIRVSKATIDRQAIGDEPLDEKVRAWMVAEIRAMAAERTAAKAPSLEVVPRVEENEEG